MYNHGSSGRSCYHSVIYHNQDSFLKSFLVLWNTAAQNIIPAYRFSQYFNTYFSSSQWVRIKIANILVKFGCSCLGFHFHPFFVLCLRPQPHTQVPVKSPHQLSQNPRPIIVLRYWACVHIVILTETTLIGQGMK